MLILTETTVEQILVALRYFQKQNATLNLLKFFHNCAQVANKLGPIVLALEMCIHFFELYVEAGLVLSILFHHFKLVFVILTVFVQDLTYAHQFCEHVQFVWISQLEVLLLIVKE